jgi:hypothetical protein
MTRNVVITVTGGAFFQPILDLTDRLLSHPPRKPVAGRVGGLENGYAISIVLLLVVALESFVGRVSYLQGRQVRSASVPDYIATLRRSFRLKKSLAEVFVLRDAIAHGHVWELDISDHETHIQVLHRAHLLAGYGDKKHRKALNLNTRRSSAAGLNLVPSAVGIKDVSKVFSIVWRTLEFLARNDLIERAAFSFRGRFRGKPFDFWDIQQLLEDAT